MKKNQKKIILFFTSVVMTVLAFNYTFSWRRMLFSREYVKSEKYFKENIDDIKINNMHFTFEQAKEITDVESFYEKIYHLYNEVNPTEHYEYMDKFNNYIHIKSGLNNPADQGPDFEDSILAERCYLDNHGNICGATFSYYYECNTINDNPIDSNIQVYITNEKLENAGLPDVNGEEYSACSIYDYNRFDMIKHNNIFNRSEIVEGMELYQGNVCTAYFDGTKYYYFYGSIGGDSAEVTNKIDSYCHEIYDLTHQRTDTE